MRKGILVTAFLGLLCVGVSTAHAIPVFDVANHVLNALRNVMIEGQHIQTVIEAGKRLQELRRMVGEVKSFNQELIENGFSEIFPFLEHFRRGFPGEENARIYSGDPFSQSFQEVLRNNPAFSGAPSEVELIQDWMSHADSGTLLSYYLNAVPDPVSEARPYIAFEQAQIAETFEESRAIQDYVETLGEEAREVEGAASQANLLGAARLGAASNAKLYEVLGVLLSSQGRLAELQAIRLEQVSREEKADELARQKLIRDLDEFVRGSGARLGGAL